MNTTDFSKIFHLSSKDHSKGHPPIPKNPADWPREWKIQYYKTYPRFAKIILPEVKPQADFFELILKRKSSRQYDGRQISLSELSVLLKYSCGITRTGHDGISRRAQASGGGRYPIEMYPIVFVPSEGLPAGLYHYDVKNHQLDVLWERDFDAASKSDFFTYEWVKDTSIAFVMTAVFERNRIKYGERGYRYILLEAGHIGQNIHLISEALNLKSCALGGTRDIALEELLDIDGATESVVYSLVVGK